MSEQKEESQTQIRAVGEQTLPYLPLPTSSRRGHIRPESQSRRPHRSEPTPSRVIYSVNCALGSLTSYPTPMSEHRKSETFPVQDDSNESNEENYKCTEACGTRVRTPDTRGKNQKGPNWVDIQNNGAFQNLSFDSILKFHNINC